METAKGKTVKIRFQCRTQEGKDCRIGEGDTMEALLGAGQLPPSLENAIAALRPGERAEVTIPPSEVQLLPLPRLVESETPPGVSYDFGPGEGIGDVGEMIPPRPRRPRDNVPPGVPLYFRIEVLEVKEPA